MKVHIPESAIRIISAFDTADYEIYIVGGAVRDILMEKPVYDWDFTTNAEPSEILKILPDAYYNNKFGTVGFVSEDADVKPYEITTFRTEYGYSDSRRPDNIKWGKTLTEDLQRRDFTVNAMALQRIEDDEFKLIDPFDGQKDIKLKLIRAVGDANERFSEDALRLMRAVRIATELGFKIEVDTLNALKMHAGNINKISKERVRDELLKILASKFPYEGMVTLQSTGLMQEILPELEKTFGVEQKSPERHHIYDVGTHSLLALKFCPSKDPVVRFAALLHDVGKAQTYKKLPSGVITFYNHEIVSAAIAKRIAARLKLSKKQTDKLVGLVRYHQFTLDEKQTDSAIRRFITNVGVENITDMLDLRIGDRLGGGAAETSWRLEEFKKRLVEVQKQPFTVHDLKIDGDDVMKKLDLKPGPQVGKILSELYEKVVGKEIPNEREVLMQYLEQLNPLPSTSSEI
jgi:putative nucleotidyltransferase with HDIG domain